MAIRAPQLYEEFEFADDLFQVLKRVAKREHAKPFGLDEIREKIVKGKEEELRGGITVVTRGGKAWIVKIGAIDHSNVEKLGPYREGLIIGSFKVRCADAPNSFYNPVPSTLLYHSLARRA